MSIRRRIVLLIGSLGGVVSEVITKVPSQQSLVSWDNGKKLEFAVPFSDMKPEIYLGKGLVYMHVHVVWAVKLVGIESTCIIAC